MRIEYLFIFVCLQFFSTSSVYRSFNSLVKFIPTISLCILMHISRNYIFLVNCLLCHYVMSVFVSVPGMAQWSRICLLMQETQEMQIQSLQSRKWQPTLAWQIPWKRRLVGCSLWAWRVRHNWVAGCAHTQTHTFFFSLRSILSDMSMAILPFFGLPFASSVISHPFSLGLCLSL